MYFKLYAYQYAATVAQEDSYATARETPENI